MAETWDGNYEAEPGPDASPSLGWDEFNTLKTGVRTRLQNEHRFDLGTPATTAQGWHKQGSALVYFGSTEPTTRPDGVTEFTTADLGRLWFDTSELVLHVMTEVDDGVPVWLPLSQRDFKLFSGITEPADSLGDDGDFYFQYAED